MTMAQGVHESKKILNHYSAGSSEDMCPSRDQETERHVSHQVLVKIHRLRCFNENTESQQLSARIQTFFF